MNQECNICGKLVWKTWHNTRGSELYRCGTCVRTRKKVKE